ncbi:unnamed protein product [Lactuca saligna]|uniref:Uncharacterized protein n=1 Tax=Lactuca saligna TaxID=75948 RepID=A0AA35VR82_LACSI|nr:unnamed protein product [Lactuca saligna]
MTPFLVAAVRCLRHVNLDSVELAFCMANRDELRTKLLGLEEEKHKFDEHCDFLVGDKESMEEQVAKLDGLVEHFYQRIEALVEEKKVLESRVDEWCRELEAEVLRRKTMRDDMMWLLQKGVVWVMDKMVESIEFSLGVKKMKEECMATGMAMHASTKDFMDTNIASYLRLDELDLVGLCQLCNDPNSEDVPPKHDPSKAGIASDLLGK